MDDDFIARLTAAAPTLSAAQLGKMQRISDGTVTADEVTELGERLRSLGHLDGISGSGGPNGAMILWILRD